MNAIRIEYVTVKEFITAVWEGYLEYSKKDIRENAAPSYISTISDDIYKCDDLDQLLNLGWDEGWLEEQDILWKDRFIERRNAARIVHEFLRLRCNEEDEKDFRHAEILTDLYDCKVCAKHVAQVYLKGIIPAKENRRFQLLQKIDEDELREIVCRMFDRKGVIK